MARRSPGFQPAPAATAAAKPSMADCASAVEPGYPGAHTTSVIAPACAATSDRAAVNPPTAARPMARASLANHARRESSTIAPLSGYHVRRDRHRRPPPPRRHLRTSRAASLVDHRRLLGPDPGSGVLRPADPAGQCHRPHGRRYRSRGRGDARLPQGVPGTRRGAGAHRVAAAAVGRRRVRRASGPGGARPRPEGDHLLGPDRLGSDAAWRTLRPGGVCPPARRPATPARWRPSSPARASSATRGSSATTSSRSSSRWT